MKPLSPLLRGPYRLFFQGQLVGTIRLTSAEYPGGCDGSIEFTPLGESMRESMQFLTQEPPIDPVGLVPDRFLDDCNWIMENADGDRFPIFVPAIHRNGEISWVPNL